MWTLKSLKLKIHCESGHVCRHSFSDVHDDLFGVDGYVLQKPDLLPVVQPIIASDEANHRCGVCRLDNGIGTM